MTTNGTPSDIGSPSAQPTEHGNRGAMMRLFDRLDEAEQEKLLAYAIELARKPKA